MLGEFGAEAFCREGNRRRSRHHHEIEPVETVLVVSEAFSNDAF